MMIVYKDICGGHCSRYSEGAVRAHCRAPDAQKHTKLKKQKRLKNITMWAYLGKFPSFPPGTGTLWTHGLLQHQAPRNRLW